MARWILFSLALSLSLRAVFADDFKKTYPLKAGGQIFIENVLGDIRVKAFKGDGIEVVGSQKGKDGEKVDIVDTSYGNRIEIRLRPPLAPGSNARVDFEVRVPDTAEFNFNRLSSFSGNVDISGISGRIRAESVRGNVELKDVKGLVSASSFSGNIKVELAKEQGRGNMRFSSISGNIDVSAPAGLDALVDISSASGLLRTDFPLEVQELRYGPGRSARGRLGSGLQILHIRSVTGRVNLVRR